MHIYVICMGTHTHQSTSTLDRQLIEVRLAMTGLETHQDGVEEKLGKPGPAGRTTCRISQSSVGDGRRS